MSADIVVKVTTADSVDFVEWWLGQPPITFPNQSVLDVLYESEAAKGTDDFWIDRKKVVCGFDLRELAQEGDGKEWVKG